MGLYGNIISHIPRSHFNIVRIVANQASLAGIVEEVNDGDYVLVDYSLGGSFNTNLTADNGINYHNTVWQKGFKTTEWMPPDEQNSIWDVPVEQRIPPSATFFAIARLHSSLASKSYSTLVSQQPAAMGVEQDLNTNLLIPIPINQIPEVVTLPDEFNNFGPIAASAINSEFNEAGQIDIQSPTENDTIHTIERVFTKYGTQSYSYLTK